MNAKTALLLSFLVVFLTACASAPVPVPLRTEGKKRPPVSSDLKFSSFVKTDIDTVAEIHQQESFSHLRTLMEKLYRRNPREWKKGGQLSMESAIARAFDAGHDWRFPELNGKRGADCFYLAFQENYQGDRVLAFIAGMATMIMASYNEKTELYVLDELDPQKLYNSARNVEIAVWKLSGTRDSRGELFLLSNANDASNRNMSFEREFGKLIAQQDTLARIIAEKTNRTIVRAIQSVASAVFLPI
ncbi:hypothetical protein SCD_n01732 [Sulfuricella denitrificans skB26]|uniref:Lipoprotein n=1 Tax=Sulfuricella denitrificans (strain DSM 22764 / NBRC 105220 / skB26) TaxID=1163617 RepID=S6B4M6_SULDS|nr:hypothetical protein [Sulfuricella denitrificans]BAN35547.1 hypothetical protein SCD_n01732 [Sulfuricella denitrificans skB26]